MMKIKNEKDVFVLPDRGVFLLADNENIERMLETLMTYFVQKKKTKGVVTDDEGALIDNKDCSFIYLSKYENIDTCFEFKPKTILNSQLSEFVINNAKEFLSLENIRYEVNELLTDQGMIRFGKLLTEYTGLDLEITSENFDLTKILHCLRIEADYFTQSQKMMLLYNLYIYLNRKKFRIIYVDFEVDNSVCNWLYNRKSINSLILVNNSALIPPAPEVFDGLIKMSSCDFVDSYEIRPEQTNLVSYLFHPVTQANMTFQTEKNKSFMKNFEDHNTTFFLRFASEINA